MLTSDPSFTPPHCPHRSCVHHRDPTGFRFVRHGSFRRRAPPEVIRRFRCLACRRTFSTQSFDTTYWLRRPELQKPLLEMLSGCMAFRQAGRVLRCDPSTLVRQASRLGRHCLLVLRAYAPKTLPAEDLVLDGLVSFEYSQYWPFEIMALAGAKSHFIYGFSDAELRRSGRMTDAQKKRRLVLETRHGRPRAGATQRATEALLSYAVPAPAAIVIRSDEHQAYPRAFRRLPHDIDHRTVSSRRCRSRNNPLFAIDLLDGLIRHSSSNHKRETLAFSKRRQGAMERMAILATWCNYTKRISEARRDSPTPAQVLGITSRPVAPEGLLAARLFPDHHDLPAPLDDYYWRRVPTRQVPNGTRHQLKLAV